MLILTRRMGETIIISENIYCTVIGVRGNQVRLAFAAPESVSINREEIQRRIWRDQEEETADLLEHNETVVNRLISRLKGMIHSTPVTQQG